MRVRLLKIIGKRYTTKDVWTYHLVGYAELGTQSGSYGAEKPLRISTTTARRLLGNMAFQPDNVMEFALPITVVSPSLERTVHEL